MREERESFGRRWRVLALAAALIGFVFGPVSRTAQAANGTVVIYASQDEVYAEPILKGFERETGIRVLPNFDSEAVKTVGLANRLLAERSHTQCDVFWSNEELRTRQLAAAGLFRATNGWAAIGFRSRRVVINTARVPTGEAPTSLQDLAGPKWKGKVAVAYPLFGTTATHFLALRQQWGEARWQAWCRALAANKPYLVDGNSVVVKLVGSGEALVGLTDSDDIADGQREGLPIAPLPMTDDTLLIPNTVAVLRDAPHAGAAQRLFEYLQRPATRAALVAAKALEAEASPPAAKAGLHPRWDDLLRDLETGTATLKEIFLR